MSEDTSHKTTKWQESDPWGNCPPTVADEMCLLLMDIESHQCRSIPWLRMALVLVRKHGYQCKDPRWAHLWIEYFPILSEGDAELLKDCFEPGLLPQLWEG